MYSIDRLNSLLHRYGGSAVPVGTRLHPVIDNLDRQAGVNTTGGIMWALFSTRGIPVNGVGKRIELHEARLSRNYDRCSVAACCGDALEDACGCH